MNITTTRFGDIEVPEERMFAFPEGIPGFPEFKSAALLNAVDAEELASVEGSEKLFFLQSVADPDLAFLCMDPFSAFSEYEVDIDESALDIETSTEALVLTIMTVSDEDALQTVNLRAPIIANTRTRRAAQVVLADPRWSVTQQLEA